MGNVNAGNKIKSVSDEVKFRDCMRVIDPCNKLALNRFLEQRRYEEALSELCKRSVNRDHLNKITLSLKAFEAYGPSLGIQKRLEDQAVKNLVSKLSIFATAPQASLDDKAYASNRNNYRTK